MRYPQTRREKEIWQVCDDLMNEGALGHKVTGDAIRTRLLEQGLSKGSPNEIYKYRTTWREARGIVEEDFSQPFRGQGYTPLADPLMKAVESIRTEIRNEAEEEIEKIRREAQGQIKQFQIATQENQQELNRVLEKNQLLNTEVSELQSDCRQWQQILSEERQQKAVLEQRTKSSEAAYDFLEQETRRILDELKQSHLEAQDHLKEQLTATTLQYRKEFETLKTQLETEQRYWTQEIERFKTNNKELDVHLGKLENKLDLEYQKAQEIAIDTKQLESKIESLKGERKTYQDKVKELELKLTVSDTELKQIKNLYEMNQEQHLEVYKQLQNKIQVITKLEERNRQLHAIITEKYFSDVKLTSTEQT